MPEVQEKEITLEEASSSQDEIYTEQREKLPEEAKPYSPETVKQSEETLKADLEARRKKEQEEKNKERTPQEILEQLGIKEDAVPRTLSLGEQERTYIQKPLSFVAKIQFLSFIGEVLDKAMTGPNSLKLNSLFEVPDYRGADLSATDFSDAQTFVQAIGKIMVYAPDFLTKSYLIWLRVPELEKPWAAEAMEESLTDEEGFDIIETFVDQNWKTMQDFFGERIPKLRDRLSARYRASQSEQ